MQKLKISRISDIFEQQYHIYQLMYNDDIHVYQAIYIKPTQ